jgi:hypothetical protein
MVDLIDNTVFNLIQMNSSYHSIIDVNVFGVLCGNEALIYEIMPELNSGIKKQAIELGYEIRSNFGFCCIGP